MNGYCTLEDVRRALRSAELPGDVSQDKDIAIDAIVAQTRTLEKELSRHYYEPNGINEDNEGLIPTSVNTRDDEHDIPTQGGYVVGAYDGTDNAWTPASGTVFESRQDPDPKEQIRRATDGNLDDDTVPTYTRIRLARRDVDAVNTLNVLNADGGYDDWVASSDYDGGVGTQHRGEDYWVRINNGGVSELYIDIHALDDDITGFSNAVYVDIDFGRSGIPRNVRRAVAFRAGADLVEEAVIEIPQNATLYNIDTKAEEMREQANRLLEAET